MLAEIRVVLGVSSPRAPGGKLPEPLPGAAGASRPPPGCTECPGAPPGCAECPGRCPGRARRVPLPGAPSAPGPLPGAPSAPGGVLGEPGGCPSRVRRVPRDPFRVHRVPWGVSWASPAGAPPVLLWGGGGGSWWPGLSGAPSCPQVFCLFAGHLPSLLHIGVKRETPYTVSPTVAPGPTFGRGVTTCEGREEAGLGGDKTGDGAFVGSCSPPYQLMMAVVLHLEEAPNALLELCQIP